MLTCHGVLPAHQGTYSCEAYNILGSVLAMPNTYLTVEGVLRDAQHAQGNAPGSYIKGGYDDNVNNIPEETIPEIELDLDIVDKPSVCPRGSFNSDAVDEEECIKCFCFEATDDCTSSLMRQVTVRLR